MDNKYYLKLDIIRLFSCVTVFLYHLNLLKGGFLSVCIFFVLSGYLAVISEFKKEKFSFKEYYKSRLLHIYLPLLIVVFLSITAINFIKDVNWLNLKPETTSVILGYNNYWQLSANLDYFARHVNSPFIHFWYIGILLQFELVFPIIFIMLKKIGDKISKIIPIFLLVVLSAVSVLYFYQIYFSKDIMTVYYDTLSRAFSLIFGVTIGFIHSYYKSIVFKSKLVFYIYLLILSLLMIFIDNTSTYLPFIMILTTIVSCRLVSYSITETEKKYKLLKAFAGMTYEIYLIQYPIIFIMQYIKIEEYKLLITIAATIVLACILHFSINIKKKDKFKIFRYILLISILLIGCYGMYIYIVTKDHTKEMKELEKQLTLNEKMMKKKQEEYLEKIKKEEKDWLITLNGLQDDEERLKNLIINKSVVGVGDSVMLGALDNLYEKFLNGYFDAKISRTCYVANDILQNLKSKNMLGEIVILNLGTNGDCPESYKAKIMNTVENKKVFWINATNDKEVNVNKSLKAFSNKYDNLYLIDWESISRGHNEYFVADKIHLTNIGKKAYTQAIYDSIYEVYLKELNEKKDALVSEHEKKEKSKVSFYGNDLLLNAYDYIYKEFNDAKFLSNKKYTYNILKKEIESGIKNNTLSYNIVFVFDRSLNLTKEQYTELVNMLKDYKVYIVLFDDNINIKSNNLTLIEFYKEIQKHKEYIIADKIHLTKEGSKVLTEMLVDCVKKLE